MARLYEDAQTTNGLIQAMRRFASRRLEADSRQSVLENAGISIMTLKFDDDASSFADRLIAILNRKSPKDAGAMPRLLSLLQHFLDNDPDAYALVDEDVALFERLLNEWKLRAQKAGPAPATVALTSLLDDYRQLTTFCPKRRYTINIDRVLLSYDLQKLVGAVKTPLLDVPRGICAFAIGGHYDLQNYVFARIHECLKRELGFEISRHRFRVGPTDFSQLWDVVNPQALISSEAVETLLIVIHQSVPADAMQKVAAQFLKDAREKLLPTLEQRNRLLVILWYHEGGAPLDIDVKLPAPDGWDIERTVKWFKIQLAEQEVGQPDLDQCADYLRQRLQASGADPRETFRAMMDCLKHRGGLE